MVQATWRFIPVVLCFPEYSSLCPSHDQHGASVPSRMYWASGSRSSAVGTNSHVASGTSGVTADMARLNARSSSSPPRTPDRRYYAGDNRRIPAPMPIRLNRHRERRARLCCVRREGCCNENTPHFAAVAPLRPHGFQSVAASFTSPTWGVALGPRSGSRAPVHKPDHGLPGDGQPGSGSHGHLLWTRDAGRTWYPVRF
jgi:hypothetical protein